MKNKTETKNELELTETKNKLELRINLSFCVNCKDLAKARNQLEETFSRENRTAENEFWDNLELVEIIE